MIEKVPDCRLALERPLIEEPASVTRATALPDRPALQAMAIWLSITEKMAMIGAVTWLCTAQ